MFHFRAGWFFERLENSDVRITKREDAKEDAPIICEVVIPPDSWASIVAVVSQYGDNNPYYQQALDFHGK